MKRTGGRRGRLHIMSMQPDLAGRCTPGARVDGTPGGGALLEIPTGPPGHYRLAQLDNYAPLQRRAFPEHPPRTFSLRARASATSLPGTWGFGFWNDPFILSLGLGGIPFRLPALPNAAWFFHASPDNYLSLQEEGPAHGLLAQAFHSPRFHTLLIPAALSLPFSPRRSRRLLGRVVEEGAADLRLDVTAWHIFRLAWRADRVSFWVDEALHLETPVSPRPPLGVVIWIDNQFAAFTPEGKIRWGLLENQERAWLEIEELELI